MKKKLFISLLVLLIAALPMCTVYAEGEDTGQDSRSQSMSVDSGEEPIADLSVTQDPGVAVSADDEAYEESPVSEVVSTIRNFNLHINWMYVGPIAVGVALLLIVIMAVSHSRKKKHAYAGKH